MTVEIFNEQDRWFLLKMQDTKNILWDAEGSLAWAFKQLKARAVSRKGRELSRQEG